MKHEIYDLTFVDNMKMIDIKDKILGMYIDS